MAVKGKNSAFFGVDKIDFNAFQKINFEKMKVPNLEFNNLDNKITSVNELNEKQIKKQDEILNFLKGVSIYQAQTAEKQEKNNRRLTYLSLIFAFISITPILNNWLNTNKTDKLTNKIDTLENRLLIQSETTSKLSTKVLELQQENIKLHKEYKNLSSKK